MILKGGYGTGKTFLGTQLLTHFSNGGDHKPKTPISLKSASEWRMVVKPGDDLLVLVDDLFGTAVIDKQKNKKWESIFVDMHNACSDISKEGTVYLIITVRDTIFSSLAVQATMAKFKLFDEFE